MLLTTLMAANTWAFRPPDQPSLDDFDRREQNPAPSAVSAEQAAAASAIRARAPKVHVDFDDVTGSPKIVSAGDGFLSGPDARGTTISSASTAAFAAGDPHRATKAFLQEHRQLFGHGAEALDTARVRRDFVTPHNGLHTVVWEQRVDGIPVFEGVLVSHTTQRGELVNLSSQFLPDVETAALGGATFLSPQALGRGDKNVAAPPVSGREAVALAARNLGEELASEKVTAIGAATSLSPQAPVRGDKNVAAPIERQKFHAPALRGESSAQLVWLAMDKATLRLCWDVVLTSRRRQEMFRVLVDARTGEALVRRGLTHYLSEASYRVFTSDSPSPFSPGHPTPLTSQPPLVARTLVTLSALDTNASPAGWINDGGNETLGNNVDAHLDRNNDDLPDLPRPHGSPFRVFDFPLDLATQDPNAYGDAAVVQLFYLCNWMHDRLYELGFTEAAGNFQTDNFGRGGLGGDAVQADAQDGSGTDNANMSTPPDGGVPLMQMYIFTGPSPRRDGDLDAEIVLHEYTHGLSDRRVGGGVGIGALQTGGMGEGWSDFYALALLSEPGDDVNGNYACGAYATYQLSPGFAQNYYFGIRRYPYSTDLAKNPLTFKDIDPAQASAHSGVPRSPVIGNTANEVHNMGEVWCVMLWEARASLINKYGWAVGNHLILQLVTDGMNLSPANPNFVQARDAILQADRVSNNGANLPELWVAFAKRGLGNSASSPSSITATGVHESFDLPDDLAITPRTGFISSGPVGGPFSPTGLTFTLTNQGSNALTWTLINTSVWLNVSPSSGTLAPGGAADFVTASLNASAASQPMGIYSNVVWFTNLTSGLGFSRWFKLRVGQPDYFTELFDATSNDLAFQTFTFTPNGSASFHAVCREPATNFPTDPTGGTPVSLVDDSYAQVTLAGAETVALYGERTGVFYIGSNGYLTLEDGDEEYEESLAYHFSLPRVAALFDDLNPEQGGTISWRQISNRVAVTYLNVLEYGVLNRPNSFQIEMFFDGRIRLTYLAVGASDGLVGLSAGQGVPAGFDQSDFSRYPWCRPSLVVVVPASATEGDGLLAGVGSVRLPEPLATNLVVALASSNTNEATASALVTIPAGATNAPFDLTITDDLVLDGTQTATIKASAEGFHDGSAGIAVFDNETAVLRVVMPARATEGGGNLQGTVELSAAPAANVSMDLASSDTFRIQVPASVVIPAGATSVVFTITVVDNTRIESWQNITVTASVPNWTPGVATIRVLDNESRSLTVLLPAPATEGDGTLSGAGLVRLAGTLPTNMLVSLVSSNTGKVTVPATVLIPAGQLTASFDLTIVDNPILDGDQTVFIAAGAQGFVSSAASMLVIDDETPPPPWNPTPPDLSTNIPANLVLGWSSASGDVTNAVFCGTDPVPGFADWVGLTTGTNWALPLLAPNTTYYWQIVSLRLGVAMGPVWRFTTRGVHHLEWSAITSPQLANAPLHVTLSARDELGRDVANFTGPVSLAARGAATQVEVFRADFESGLQGFTVNNTFGSGGGLWHWSTGRGLAAGHSASHSLYYGLGEGPAGGGNYSTGDANGGAVLSPALNLPAGPGRLALSFNSFLQCEAVTNFDVVRVDVSTNGGASYATAASKNTPGGPTNDTGGLWLAQTIDLSAWAGAAATLRFSFDTIDTYSNLFEGWYVDDVAVVQDRSFPVALAPTVAAAFTNGIWSGWLLLTNLVDDLVLLADDGAGHTARSGAFNVIGPGPLLPLPVCSSGEWSLSFATVPGRTYLIQYTDDLADPVWWKLGSITGDGTMHTITDVPEPEVRQRFYRVKVQ